MTLPRLRPSLLATALLLSASATFSALSWERASAQGRPGASGSSFPGQDQGRIAAIRVEGNQRIEEPTVRSYMLVQPGDAFASDRINLSVRSLFATGLFADVAIRREGDDLVVKVDENPIVNRVVFEGNNSITSDILAGEAQLKPRSIFTPAAVQSDRLRLLEVYARRGRYGVSIDPKIIRLPQNRVDLVFEISEGEATYVQRIGFVGNRAFSESELKEIVSTKETAWWRFLSSDDTYDPDRVAFDRELLRRWYLKGGFVDARIVSATTELAPDRSGFFVTYTIEEGERYRVGKVEIDARLRGVDPETLRPVLRTIEGDWYDADLVERTVQIITDQLGNAGFAFSEVRPRTRRNADTRTVDLTYEIAEGPRVYIERIDISGNVRTKDSVIRREFRVAEGDAFDAARIRRTRQRIQDLGYFGTVNVNTQPGSAPDRAVVNVEVTERATGELNIGGGFSTEVGALADISLRERNLLGTGLDARIQTLIGQRRSSIDLSVTDPYFLDLNLLAGFDLFYVQRDFTDIAGYDDERKGFAIRFGYEVTDYLRQSWTYTLADREITNVDEDASRVIKDQEGQTLLSQIGTTLTYDRRDSRVDPREGYVIRVGADVAGLGGDVSFVRPRLDANYYIPLEETLGSPDYVVALSAGLGYLWAYGEREERIIDRFFLGGENLRGFATGGAGPRDIVTDDALGGRVLGTASAELRFPLPLPREYGLLGRTFVDVGTLYDIPEQGVGIVDDATPRVGVGVGVSWRTPLGLINIDLGFAAVKESYDETELFRFGFGTRF